ncbi:hypothetical protein PC39_10867 [Salinisphaera sp. PC39]
MARSSHDNETPMNDAVRREPTAWLWLALPLLLYLMHYPAAMLLDYAVYNRWFVSELGVTEEGTVVFVAIALVLAALTARGFLRLGDKRLALWFGLLALGCLYFGGEEASWGQHWFGWVTPETWQGFNEQSETNLHNTNSGIGGLLDQLPRNLLTLGALIAGGILPLWRRARGRALDPAGRWYWLLPTHVCVPAGLLAGLATVPEKLQEALWGEPIPLDPQLGEVKELMLGVFLFLYALSAWRRLRATAQKTAG